MSQQYYEPPSYQPPPPQRRLPFDIGPMALLAVAGLVGIVCLIGVGLICILVLLAPAPPAPATPRPPISTPTTIAAGGVNLLPTSAPTVNMANIGKYINPYISAQLQGMTVIQIDVRDQATGNYVRAAQLTGSELDKFVEAFNVSVQMAQPDSTCPDHVRLSITRADNSVVTIGVCLKQVVILRGGISDLGGADAPMYPGFSDALAPYLPDAYRQLLDF